MISSMIAYGLLMDDDERPGLTVGDLLLMLAKIPDETPVYIRLASYCQGSFEDYEMPIVGATSTSALTRDGSHPFALVLEPEQEIKA
jgi:hypothetical protein